MKKEDVIDIYDQQYAEGYNDRFLLEPGYKAAAEYEYQILSTLIDKNTNWLDVGCGTGFFLSKFPDTQRAGLDLSYEMLRVARKANPSAISIVQGDFREKHHDWINKWSLVSSMWGAYVYLDSQKEIEQFLENLVSWIAPGGTLFLPVIDYEDYRPSITVPYMEETYTRDNVSYGKTIIKSFTWDYIEYIGKNHYNLISLHLEYIVELLSPYFEKIEINYYPLEEGEKVPRKAIIAKGKLAQPDTTKTAAISRTTPIFSVKTDTASSTVTEPVLQTSTSQTIGINYFIKRFKPFNISFWKKVLRFLQS